MSRIHRRNRTVPIVAVLATLVAVNLVGASAPGGWTGADKTLVRARSVTPTDRYELAGGCYALQVFGGGYVVRSGDGYASNGSQTQAEPFFFKATDLGSYMLYDSASRFLAASEGVLGEAAYSVTRSKPGQQAGGLVNEQTDDAADTVARHRANEGRGDRVVAAAKASALADWIVDVDSGLWVLALAELDDRLAGTNDGGLRLVPNRTDDVFLLELTSGCAQFPELEINVDGPVLGSAYDFQETRGYLDAHLHAMAYEFIGGRVRCGAPWHRFGVDHALVDCPDHEGDGRTAVLEQVLSGGNPVTGHTTDGWPSFGGWPKFGSLTHEQVYYRWLERAWRGGTRMIVNLLVDNGQLCKAYPYKRNSCNEMDGVRLQAQRLHEMIRYIDAQNGGPGKGWMQIVTDPFQARKVINGGKLAVIMGIEVSVPLDCGKTLDLPACDEAKINRGLDEVYDLGVRQMELVNKFDNALSGVTGDGGTTGIVVNQGNLGEVGHYWRMETCDPHEGHARDKTQLNAIDQFGIPKEAVGRDSLAGGILQMFGATGATPVYPEGPHCNDLGLSELGEKMIRAMAARGMIFDPDHMSARARTAAMDLIEEMGYSGVMSSHSWADDTIYPRVLKAGGVVTPHAGGSGGFLNKWRQHRAWADPRYLYGIGIGSDMNGFSTQGGPRGANAANKVTYPFTGFGGATVDKQRSGTRAPYDINVDGVAHYGLYPDWVEDVRRQAGADGDTFLQDMARGPEAYLQMWERAIGIAPNACRADVDDLTDAQVGALSAGMSARDVLEAVGQPDSRLGLTFSYCMTSSRTATATFDTAGTLTGVSVA